MTTTLRDARRRKRMTQDDLAEKSGVDQTHISSIEIGRRVPSDDVKKRLAKALGIAPSRIEFPAPDEPTVSRKSDRVGHDRSSDSRAVS